MTPEQRQAAKARCEAAAPGPWESDPIGGPQYRANVVGPETVERYKSGAKKGQVRRAQKYPVAFDGLGLGACSWYNADFITHARTDLPAALDHIDALEAEVARLNEEAERLRQELSRRGVVINEFGHVSDFST